MTQGPTQLLAAIEYTNHRGERRWRVIMPHSISYSTSPWHKEDGQQWILHATDAQLGEVRDFPMQNIHNWMAPSRGEDLTQVRLPDAGPPDRAA